MNLNHRIYCFYFLKYSVFIQYFFFQANSEANFLDEFTACKCIKTILIRTGFDNEGSLGCLTENILHEIYESVDQKLIESFECDHMQTYLELFQNQKQFSLLPGHKIQILEMAKRIVISKSESHSNGPGKYDAFHINSGCFSPVMRELIHSARTNHDKHPSAHRYSNLLTNFAMYNYIMAGKQCYEVLTANMPLPKPGTLRNNFFFYTSQSSNCSILHNFIFWF